MNHDVGWRGLGARGVLSPVAAQDEQLVHGL